MNKLWVGLLGVLLLIGSLYFLNQLPKLEKQAVSLDDKKTIFANVGDEVPMCKWEVKPPDRVMAENKSQAILVQVNNPVEKDCSSTISLQAPGFDFSPHKEDQTIKLTAKGNGSLSWILVPHKTGTFNISISDIVNTQVYGLTVTNAFGLTVAQAKVFSFGGTIFGPMLTVPWWWDRRKKKQDNTDQDS